MGSRYQQLNMDERHRLHRGLNQGMSLRALARELQRNPGTLSRERRQGRLESSYDAIKGREVAQARRRRGTRKLEAGNALTEQVTAAIPDRRWSPEQVAGRLRLEHHDDKSQRVSHETIYQYIYAHPAGELKAALIEALRQGHQKRRPRSRGKDRRGGIRNMRSIRERPAEAEGREVLGHWEGDLIKGVFNGNAIGTLVDRSSRYVILARVDDATAESVLEGFMRRLRTLPRHFARP
jgi:IS30 family transposase